MTDSTIRSVDVARVDAAGVFAGVPYERVRGSITGVVGEAEDVVGLHQAQPYRAEFEFIRAVDPAARSTVVVDAENRGGSSMLRFVAGRRVPLGPPSAVDYPYGLGEGCLFGPGLAYARVQWQTGYCDGVLPEAQGVGLVIERDFGRLLAQDYDRRILTGGSQSSWLVNTFVAEGFNVDPVTGVGVFTHAFAYLSGGNWLAVNRLGDDGRPLQPYVRPDAVPLTASQILTRPASDPFMVDVTSYTEYYRLRGSVYASGAVPARARRYDFPAPHATGSPEFEKVAFDEQGCNGGRRVPLNPVSSAPYVRAVLVGLATATDDLPSSRHFELGPAPEASDSFNALPGVELRVPLVDDDAQPRGGVRFPEVELPLGRPVPVSLPPCSTTSITDTCGNFGGWQPFSPEEVRRRYGSVDGYTARYAALLDGLIEQGFVLERDRESVLASSRAAYEHAAV